MQITFLLMAAQIWVAPSAHKVLQTDLPPPGAPASAQLFAAQNEFESFHVVVSGAASGVSMTTEGLGDGAGHVISGRDITLYREGFIQVTSPSGGDGAAGFWPDPLIPDVDPIVGEKRNAFPFTVAASRSTAVLVDVHVPIDAPAGVYTGAINVFGGVTATVPVTLTVWDFSVPSTSTLKSAFGLDWNAPCVGHGDSNCSDYAADNLLRARYVQAALDNHITIHTPWYSETVDSSGNADWTDFDAVVGPLFDGTADLRLKGARLTTASVNSGWASAMVAGWGSHFAAKGWSSTIFSYICDEPPATCSWSAINPRISSSHAGDASVSTLVTTDVNDAQAHGIAGLDLITPVVDQMENRPGQPFAGNQRSRYPANIWWYQSCDSFGCGPGSGVTGWPTMAIDADATRNRAMEWMSFAYSVQGELYYETAMAYYLGDPWVSQYAFGGNGDGSLFYPGTTARIGGKTEIPVESLRMKEIRDGMEDYELLALATRLGMGDQAMALARSVYPVTYQATSTPGAIDSARAELAGLILHALGKDQPPPPPADAGTPPPPDAGAPDPADAGASDGPAVDAGGADAGSADVGSNDASSAGDAGVAAQSDPGANSPPLRVASAGGGCSTSGQSGWALLALLVVAARRREPQA